MNTNPFNLTGKLLVAVPGIDDYHFDQAVVYVYEHTEKGARGLVINKPCERIFLKEIFAHLKCKIPEKTLPPLLIGGPVQRTSGFILHSTEYTNPMSHSITSDIALAETQEILHDIADGAGPQDFLMTLGCATWQSGQLEDELMDNVWLVAPSSNQILFHTPHAQKWESTLKLIGVDSYRFSPVAGKA